MSAPLLSPLSMSPSLRPTHRTVSGKRKRADNHSQPRSISTPTFNIRNGFQQQQQEKAGEQYTLSGDPADTESLRHFDTMGFRRTCGEDEMISTATTFLGHPAEIPVVAAASVTEAAPGSWKGGIFLALGGVVNKMWQFCTAGTHFERFTAGKGVGYALNGGKVSRIPGQWPGMEHEYTYVYAPDCRVEASESPETSPVQGKKRRHVEQTGSGELAKNWVVVDEAPTRISRASRAEERERVRRDATGRKVGVPVSRLQRGVSTVGRRRTGSTASVASMRAVTPVSPGPREGSGRVSLGGGTRRTSLGGGSRASLGTSPSHKHRLSLGGGRNPFAAEEPRRRRQSGSPGLPGLSLTAPKISPNRRYTYSGASLASPVSDGMTERARSPKKEMRLDPVARQLAAKKAREAREADERMAGMNEQLLGLIREARAALGTSVTVDGEEDGGDEVGGWEDDSE